MEGVLRFQGHPNYFVLWRRRLYQWKNKSRPEELYQWNNKNRPEDHDFSTAKAYYILSDLQNLETDPSQRHVLILKFPRKKIHLAATNPGSYQAWLSCFAVFHVRNSLDRKAPYFVSSTCVKAIWAVLDDIHRRGCLTEHVFRDLGNEQNVEVLRLELLTKGPGRVDPNEYQNTTVATVAKVLLDSLPESLWTEQALSEFGNDSDTDSLRRVIASLPEQNSELLKKLFITLSSVASNIAKSRMSDDDLARVVTPVLDSRELSVGPKLRKITKLCINQYQQLFFGAPHLIVIVPKIEDILTYKRMDYSNRKRRKKHSVFQSRGEYKNERMPRLSGTLITDRKPRSGSSTSLQLLFQSDDESSDSYSHQSQRHLKYLRPQFTNEYSPRYNTPKPSGRNNSMILTDLPETEPVSNIEASNLSLALALDNDLEEKGLDNENTFDMFQGINLLVPNKENPKFRGRSKSVVLNRPVETEPINMYSSRNIKKVVGKRRAANTRLVKSLETDSFFVYGYLTHDDHSLTIDGLFPTRSRHSTRHRIQVPIAEDEEFEEYQKDLIEQNKETELLEVFGPSQLGAAIPRSPSLKKASTRIGSTSMKLIN